MSPGLGLVRMLQSRDPLVLFERISAGPISSRIHLTVFSTPVGVARSAAQASESAPRDHVGSAFVECGIRPSEDRDPATCLSERHRDTQANAWAPAREQGRLSRNYKARVACTFDNLIVKLECDR